MFNFLLQALLEYLETSDILMEKTVMNVTDRMKQLVRIHLHTKIEC